MQSMMYAILECSISMSFLVFVYYVTTPLLIKKYSAKWLYYSWLPIIIGLVIPFRPHIDNAFIQMDLPVQTTSNAGVAVNNVAHISQWHCFALIWVVGIFIFITHHVIKHYRFVRMVNRWSEPVTDKEILTTFMKIKDEMSISEPVDLRTCNCISSPMLIGVFHPVVLIPSADYSQDEIYFVLKHELIHLVRKDLWYRYLVLLTSAVHWFNPVIYLMAKAVAQLCEISCDAEVVRNFDTSKRQRYSEAIISIIKSLPRVETALSTHFYSDKRRVKNRIFSIMDSRKKNTSIIIFCLILIGTINTGSIFTIKNSVVKSDSLHGFSAKVKEASIETYIDNRGNILQKREENFNNN